MLIHRHTEWRSEKEVIEPLPLYIIIKACGFQNNILFHYAHFNGFVALYTHQNANYVVSCSMLSLSKIVLFLLYILRLSLRVRSSNWFDRCPIAKYLCSLHFAHSSYLLSFHFIYLYYDTVFPFIWLFHRTPVQTDNNNAHRIRLLILFIWYKNNSNNNNNFIWHCWECRRAKNKRENEDRRKIEHLRTPECLENCYKI